MPVDAVATALSELDDFRALLVVISATAALCARGRRGQRARSNDTTGSHQVTVVQYRGGGPARRMVEDPTEDVHASMDLLENTRPGIH